MDKGGARNAGLCATCAHARRVETPRSVFTRCALAATDPRFERYPALPVLECEGWTPRADARAGAPPAGER